ncbi:hypothetical protein TIFTF001_026350 [Ficus carica]|uniref:Uncharacterized protein n=1 Tax=Ficus carica TaxID=3494 RepID=A0AA88DL83_FICCA|nr:hypothetical protein TIFTF001_026350 [Ficus carica]
MKGGFWIRGLERHEKPIPNLRENAEEEEEDEDQERERAREERGEREREKEEKDLHQSTSPFEGELTPLVNGDGELLLDE